GRRRGPGSWAGTAAVAPAGAAARRRTARGGRHHRGGVPRTRTASGKPMKILVVEDDRKVAGFIEQGLKEEGHVVDVAPDGDEATMLAHVYEYDIILLDVVLPKKNGFQVAAELRREGRTT